MSVSKEKEYCFIKCRVSDEVQLKGGGLDRQESAGRYFAREKGWEVDKVARTSHKATTDVRADMDDDIAYIKQRKREGVNIRHYIVQNLDRFTRYGTPEYFLLKKKLEDIGVNLIDTGGIIQPKKNTLAHLGEYKYSWSEYFPSEGAEAMEAQKSKDESRTILTRMVGAEILLTLQGYGVRRAPDGLQNEKILVGAKERIVMAEGPNAHLFRKMFEMRAEGVPDEEICQRLNAMGFRTRVMRRWDKADQENPRIVGHTGGNPLTVKQLQRYILQTAYAGFAYEKWTNGELIKLQRFDGIVSIDTYNRANRGKRFIKQYEDIFELRENYSPWSRTKRLRDNPMYPWKCILCPHCKSEMTASPVIKATGKQYHGYHCGTKRNPKRDHAYFRVPKDDFEKNVTSFLDGLKFDEGFTAGLELHLMDQYRTREKEILLEASAKGHNVANLKTELAQVVAAFSTATTDIMRRSLEEKAGEIERQILQAESERGKAEVTEKSIRAFRKYADKLMEHPGKILTDADSLVSRKALLSLFFVETPTYQEILNGTAKLQPIFRLSEVYKTDKAQLVTTRGIEPRFDP